MNSEEVLEVRESVVEIKKSRLKRVSLRELYLNGAQTLSDLSRVCHTSVPSMTSLVSELMQENWVVELGTGASKSGRKPTLYGLTPSHRYVLVWDIDKYQSQCVLFNLNHEAIYTRTFNLLLFQHADYAAYLTEQTQNVLEFNGVSVGQLLGVGVSMPGLIEAKTGLNYTYPTLENEPLSHILTTQLGVPAFILNDAKAVALGENRFGLAKGVEHVFAINADWGIGLGILINGEVFQGSAGFSGELGHIQVKPEGELCSCGKTGCLETVSSSSALIRRAKEEITGGRVSALAQEHDAGRINSSLIIEAAHNGDELCIDLLHEIGFELGKALAIAVYLFNPQMIIVDGLLAQADRYITIPIEQALQKYCLSEMRNGLTVKASQLGSAARQFGAYTYVLEKVIEEVN